MHEAGIVVPDSAKEDGTMRRSHEPTDPEHSSSADEAAIAVRGGTAYLADIERRLTPYFERIEPRQRAIA
jgi:hypothetical protein